MKKIGLVGCGTIGTEVARALKGRLAEQGQLAAVTDIKPEQAKRMLADAGISVSVLSAKELIAAVDLVVEAASPQAVRELLPLVLEKEKEILAVSTGGLIQFPGIFDLLAKHHGKIHIPSGAIAALDGVRVAAQAGIDKITLTTTKPPRALTGASYIEENKIDLDNLTEEKVVFSGTVQEAVAAFPKNINVCATLALTCGRPELVRVKIVAVPGQKKNIHQIEIEGASGKITCRTENVPSPTNPKTSYLAVLSVLETLERIL